MAILIGDKPIFGNYKVLIKNISFNEFLEFATEDISCELLNGVLIINSPDGYTHESIFRFLITYLDQIGLKKNIGRALGSRFVVKLDPKWGPEPDIIFYSNRKKNLIKKAYFDGIPDLIIEILSPTNAEDDLEIKLPKYQEFKIPEVWIIDPENKTLTIYDKNTNQYIFNKENNKVTSKIFPDIKLYLEWLWSDEFDPVECLKEI
ncbi:MAG: Uma2 family endonuclease [Candidatus Hodarchaeales archaeon]|jgi:Uma2 family endonuclease